MRKRRGIFGIGDCLADGNALNARDRDDVSQRGIGYVDTLQAGE